MDDCNKSFNAFLENFKKHISKSGFKNSLQKDYILKILYFSKEHLSAEEITTLVKKEFNIRIGLTTVYKTINFFEKMNIIEFLDIGDGLKRYELSLTLHHDHLVCTSCSKIIEFTDTLIEKQQIQIAENNNFELKNHVMTIYGLCKNCH